MLSNVRTLLLAAAATGLLLSTPQRAAAEETHTEVSSTQKAAITGCVTGAITGSASGWVIAILLAPLTGGASLAVAPALDTMILLGTAGCIVGATGSAAAEELTN